jgi:hypothetical protein
MWCDEVKARAGIDLPTIASSMRYSIKSAKLASVPTNHEAPPLLALSSAV